LLFPKSLYDYMHSEARTVSLYHDIFEREAWIEAVTFVFTADFYKVLRREEMDAFHQFMLSQSYQTHGSFSDDNGETRTARETITLTRTVTGIISAGQYSNFALSCEPHRY
jgi:hypothetical protein